MNYRHVALTLLLGLANPGARGDSGVGYPEGYRDWHHVKSMVILPGHALENPFAGVHHIYANDAAKAGLKSSEYADGATFVFDLLATVQGGHAIQEGERKLVGVMVRDAARYTRTGGWGFEGFAANSHSRRLTSDGGAGCFGCHTSERAHGYVFTRARE